MKLEQISSWRCFLLYVFQSDQSPASESLGEWVWIIKMQILGLYPIRTESDFKFQTSSSVESFGKRLRTLGLVTRRLTPSLAPR